MVLRSREGVVVNEHHLLSPQASPEREWVHPLFFPSVPLSVSLPLALLAVRCTLYAVVCAALSLSLSLSLTHSRSHSLSFSPSLPLLPLPAPVCVCVCALQCSPSLAQPPPIGGPLPASEVLLAPPSVELITVSWSQVSHCTLDTGLEGPI